MMGDNGIDEEGRISQHEKKRKEKKDPQQV